MGVTRLNRRLVLEEAQRVPDGAGGFTLAWVALEANRTVHGHELVVRHWPGGAAPVMLARAHPHGAWVEWLV